MRVQGLMNNIIVLGVLLSGSKMNQNNIQNNIFKKIQLFLSSNLRNIVIGMSLLIIIFISIQTYNYLTIRDLKKTSIIFFNSINESKNIFDQNYQLLSKNRNIYSTLSNLKLIQQSNFEKNYQTSSQLYKDLIQSNLNNKLYKSSIAIHASFTLIDASYDTNTKTFLNDIEFFINNIDDDLENYLSIKKELEYLLFITELDLDNINYKNNIRALELYNEINDSELISSSVKERVKKIHEFHLFK